MKPIDNLDHPYPRIAIIAHDEDGDKSDVVREICKLPEFWEWVAAEIELAKLQVARGERRFFKNSEVDIAYGEIVR